jgi:FKBP-type peptidyl-prolyl cis-trans isomerase
MPRSLALAAVVAGTLALAACGGGDEAPASTGSVAPTTASASAAPPAASASAAARPAGAVTFQGVTVSNPADLSSKPQTTSSAASTPAKLEYKDLVVGKGAAADPAATVNVQYEGMIYKNGTVFDSSWDRGAPASFPLTGVVPGFTQGIGGTTGVPPMKAGGRRIMILPPALGYPDGSPNGSIPANTPIVFIVDLLSVS